MNNIFFYRSIFFFMLARTILVASDRNLSLTEFGKRRNLLAHGHQLRLNYHTLKRGTVGRQQQFDPWSWTWPVLLLCFCLQMGFLYMVRNSFWKHLHLSFFKSTLMKKVLKKGSDWPRPCWMPTTSPISCSKDGQVESWQKMADSTCPTEKTTWMGWVRGE